MKAQILLLILFLFTINSQSQNKQIDSLLSVLSTTKNDTQKITLLNTISNLYKTSNGEKVIEYGNKALQLAKRLNLKTEQGNAYVNLGNGSIILGNYNKAVSCLTFTITRIEKHYNY